MYVAVVGPEVYTPSPFPFGLLPGSTNWLFLYHRTLGRGFPPNDVQVKVTVSPSFLASTSPITGFPGRAFQKRCETTHTRNRRYPTRSSLQCFHYLTRENYRILLTCYCNSEKIEYAVQRNMFWNFDPITNSTFTDVEIKVNFKSIKLSNFLRKQILYAVSISISEKC